MHALKLTQIGNPVGVILPKEVLTLLKLGRGDTLYLTESPDGMRITPHDPVFEGQMQAAHDILKTRRAVLRELAKSHRDGQPDLGLDRPCRGAGGA